MWNARFKAEGRNRTASLVALVIVSCATGPIAVDADRYAHHRLGYAIDRPDVAPGRWERFRHPGADLAFTRPLAAGNDATMILMSECGRSQAGPGVLARQLLIGVGSRTPLASGPVEWNGQAGWSQTLEVEEEGQRVRVKSVTLPAGKCTFDWVLVARGDFEESESEFDRWWRTFEYAPRETADGEGEQAS